MLLVGQRSLRARARARRRWPSGLTGRASTFLFAIRCLMARRLWLIQVSGVSMEPTYREGDLVLCEAFPAIDGLKRGDIIVLRRSVEPELLNIKRVAALPGDLKDLPVGTPPPSPEECVVLGDNLNVRGHWRHLRPVPLSLVIGRALAPRPLLVDPFHDRATS